MRIVEGTMISGKVVLYRGTMRFSDDPGKLKDG